jgi:hypothetical protein
MEMPGPEATMRGPGMKPALMLLRRSTARNGREPTSRTVVKPASSVFLRIDDAGNGRVEGSVFELVDLLIAIGAAAQVGVAVDEAGENVVGGEIEDLGTLREVDESRGFDGLDALVGNHECDIVEHSGRWRGRRGGRRGCTKQVGRAAFGRRQ